MLLGMNLEWANYYQADQKFIDLNIMNQTPAVGKWVLMAKEGYCRPGLYVLTASGKGVLNFSDDDVPGTGRLCNFTGAGEKYVFNLHTTKRRGGIILVSQDSGNPISNIQVYPQELDPNIQVCHPDWLATVKGINTFRSVHFVDVDSGSQEVPKWSKDNIRLWELFISCCNEANAHPWVNLPHLSVFGDYAANLGQLFNDRLNPNLVPRTEYSNEVWNWSYPWATQTSWVNNAAVSGVNGMRAKYAYMANKAFNLFESNFHRKTLRLCVGAFIAPETVTQSMDWAIQNGVRFDAIASGPYIGNPPDWPAVRALWATGLKNSAKNLMIRPLIDNLTWLDTMGKTWQGVSNKYKLPLMAYEWGPGLISQTPSDADPLGYLHRSKEMADYIASFYAIMKKYFTEGNFYSHCRPWGSQPWGLREFLDDQTLKADMFASLVAANNI